MRTKSIQKEELTMSKRLRKNIPKLKSKKGLTLVEILVGVTIIVIVFGATLGAMTQGYTNTLYNADENKSAALSKSINDSIMEAVVRQGFKSQTECENYFFGGGKSPNSDSSNAVHSAAVAIDSSVEYVPYASFPDNSKDCQYTIKTDSISTVEGTGSKVSMGYVLIQTATKSAKGMHINTSYVPYY